MPTRWIVYPLFFVLKDFLIAYLLAKIETPKKPEIGFVVDGIFGPCTKAAVFNVGVGRQGNITRILQGLLICTGFNPGGFTGYFGAGTEAAVREFQYRAGLEVDGVAGRATFAALCGWFAGKLTVEIYQSDKLSPLRIVLYPSNLCMAGGVCFTVYFLCRFVDFI